MSDRLACIIGWPVEHSLSPAMHNAAFDSLGLDWTYLAIAVRPGAAAEGMGLLRTLGIDGANVTAPHKLAVVALLDDVAEDAARLGAVNTIVREEGRYVGHNTDGEGFVRALRLEADFDPSGRSALVLGGGGAARAVAVALSGAGAEVTVSARRADQALGVAELSGGATAGWGGARAADLVVNCTSSRAELPLPRLSPETLAVDLAYGPPRSAFLVAAAAAGARTSDGLGMLVHQAGLSFGLWTGRPGPIEVMRSAAEAELRAREAG